LRGKGKREGDMSDSRYEHIGKPETKAVEECAEMIHILMKVERFGWFSYNPDDLNETTNMELVKREMDDVYKAFTRLESHMRDVDHEHWKEAK
jgi:hypothetical protein